MENLFKKNIRFIANRYEEWQFGSIISEGAASVEIKGVDNGAGIDFSVTGFDTSKMYPECRCSYQMSYVLGDRIQYLSPEAAGQTDPKVPILVQVFPNPDGTIKYIRFAMSYPDRIIEFYGHQVVAIV